MRGCGMDSSGAGYCSDSGCYEHDHEASSSMKDNFLTKCL